MKKLNCILLIDDDEPTNFWNERLIEKSNCAETVVICEDGKEGLDYINSCIENQEPLPDLIFLDLNMPGMNGWEFLEEYKTLDESLKDNPLLIMLTTSLNPDDQERMEQMNEVSGFINKPFSIEAMKEVLNKHFQD